jgi:hypothetical protein
MPKLKPTDKQKMNCIIEGTIAYYLKVNRKDKEYLATKLRISRSTMFNRVNKPETFTLEELRTLIKVCGFTSEQVLEMMGINRPT